MNFSGNDDLSCRLERLVDGELTDGEYQELLTTLESNPDGWRMCALAFLESQAWDAECNTMRAQFDTDNSLPRRSGRSRWKSMTPLILATAGSFLAAVGLGVLWQRTVPSADSLGSGLSTTVENSRQEPAGEAKHRVEPVNRQSIPNDPTRETEPYGKMTLVMDQVDGTNREIDIPVVPLDEAHSQWITQESTWIPPHVSNALRRMGYRVRRDVQWTPIELERGRHVLVPMGEVEIQPISDRDYH